MKRTRKMISKSNQSICIQIEDIFNICGDYDIPNDIDNKFKSLIEFINIMDYMDDEIGHPMDFVEFLIHRAIEEQNYRFLALVQNYTSLNIPV